MNVPKSNASLAYSRFALSLISTATIFLSTVAWAETPASKYRGWNYLAEKLNHDGFDEQLIKAAFNDQRLPVFTFVPFKLKPKETASIYADHVADFRVKRALEYLNSNSQAFKAAEKLYGVNRYLIAAIHSVETGCGQVLGQELVFNRLARVASVKDENNINENLRELQKTDPSVTLDEVKDRSEYLEKTFYPELKALFVESAKKKLDLFTLKGSYGGAFGIGQFLPLSYQKYAVDGNNNGTVSLFEPADAIFSTAHFLKANGWKDTLPPGDRLKVLWSYNRSDPYGRAVTKLAVLLRTKSAIAQPKKQKK